MKRILINLRFMVTFIVTTSAMCLSQTMADVDDLIQQGIDEYTLAIDEANPEKRALKFQRAEQFFHQATVGDEHQSGIRNADLFINLGNAALQSEHIGAAIAAYRRALVIEPGNGKAQQNLNFARSVLPEWIRAEASSGLSNSLFFWADQFSTETIAVLAAICFSFSVLLIVFGTAKRQPLLRNAALLPTLAWLILVSSIVNDHWNGETTESVIDIESILYSADSENSTSRISKPLPSGAEVTVLQKRDQWVEIRLPGGVTGWVLKSKTTRVSDF